MLQTAAFAVEFDDSIDGAIRKDYKVEENELPPLPKSVPTASEVYEKPVNPPQYNPTGKTYTIKGGTKLTLVLNNAISDRSYKGAKAVFSVKNGFTTKEGAIVPAGTIFKAKIINVHQPQLTGNGGLIALDINEIYFNGIKSTIDTKISRANSKKIFFNNIKGKRSYWSNYSKVMKPGRKVFSATQHCASVMSALPVINLLSFIPLVGGAAIYTVNFTVAPIIAVFTKGKHLTIPAGSVFQIKINSDVQIKG